ncbi:MAG: helix-turn-helix domain-containing protein [Lachnospiraceae bacterium]|nr:helix-turn-helix domain-containing protein [Lachnospiraceae bacterium]MCM1238693.1 helix-turn-helix domain-containing protein [Lachnospiraceae bacterium]MCM1304484.1 helix-turn-helix domain-containing protein [Butyrivibrio sp.]MCM1342602.1 helix-turn-helix domain-containing protein [Muribaculaceae bacterium]MCM1412095.1 helix-turn-helix domain-containing protein [Lachnospiraceae bacterium]
MSFADNLKMIRKDKNLSQEDLAELLDVSRQAVSKWEQGIGFPEVEKLLLISNRLNVSLDSLMATEIARKNDVNNVKITGTIVITSPNENVISTCYKVISSKKMRGGKNSPQFALFGVSTGGATFWGEPTSFLGWYADQEQVTKEINDIKNAIAKGIPTYELKYAVKVERHWLSVKMIDQYPAYSK